VFLTISECSVFRAYYARNWPLLSPEHGFVMLSIAMIILGVNILGNLNKEATSQESLGLAFWRIVIASGVLVLVLGVFNFIASYVFRDKARGITARNVRSHGAVAVPTPKLEDGVIGKPLTIDTSIPNGSLASSSIYSEPKPFSPLRSPLKAFSPAVRTLRRARDSILPSYYSSPNRTNNTPPYPSSTDSPTKSSKKSKRGSVGPKIPINISAPLNVDTRFAHLVQPNLAHHPATQPDIEEGKAF
jgi:hypothetical protein